MTGKETIVFNFIKSSPRGFESFSDIRFAVAREGVPYREVQSVLDALCAQNLIYNDSGGRNSKYRVVKVLTATRTIRIANPTRRGVSDSDIELVNNFFDQRLRLGGTTLREHVFGPFAREYPGRLSFSRFVKILYHCKPESKLSNNMRIGVTFVQGTAPATPPPIDADLTHGQLVSEIPGPIAAASRNLCQVAQLPYLDCLTSHLGVPFRIRRVDGLTTLTIALGGPVGALDPETAKNMAISRINQLIGK